MLVNTSIQKVACASMTKVLIGISSFLKESTKIVIVIREYKTER